VTLTVRGLDVAERRLGSEVAGVFGLAPEVRAWTITRTILADREPVAVMRDVVRPGIPLPPEHAVRSAIEAGGMVLDVLLGHGVAVAFAVTRVRPLLLSHRESVGRALGVQGTTAVLELEEIMHLASGEAVQYSSDTFAPGGIDLQVRRNLDVAAPAPLVRAVART
jgi:DNA-binding GntR family transcriptional regulator